VTIFFGLIFKKKLALTGLILCGGKSERMGTDKGLLTLKANTWAQAAVAKIASLQLPVVVSVNEQQLADYSTILSPIQLITDNKSIDIKGPLLGLLSVHILLPGEDLLVLACDMPLMETSILTLLLDSYKTQSAEAYVFTNDDVYEPLCGIYTANGLSRILQLLQSQQLAKHSMKYMLEQLHTFTIALAENQKKYFRNFNAHAELNGL